MPAAALSKPSAMSSGVAPNGERHPVDGTPAERGNWPLCRRLRRGDRCRLARRQARGTATITPGRGGREDHTTFPNAPPRRRYAISRS